MTVVSDKNDITNEQRSLLIREYSRLALTKDFDLSIARRHMGSAYARARRLEQLSTVSTGQSIDEQREINTVLSMWVSFFAHEEDWLIELKTENYFDFDKITSVIDFMLVMEELKESIKNNGGSVIKLEHNEKGLFIETNAQGDTANWSVLDEIGKATGWKIFTITIKPLQYAIILAS